MGITARSLPLSFSSLSFSSRTCSESRSLSFPLAKEQVDYRLHSSAFQLMKKIGAYRKDKKVQATLALDVSETEKKAKNLKGKVPLGFATKTLDLSQVLKYPLLTEAAVKNLANNNTLVFVVHAKADKKMIRAAVKTFLSVQPKKVNTSISSDGAKKAFIMLGPEDNASEVAKRIGIFTGGS